MKSMKLSRYLLCALTLAAVSCRKPLTMEQVTLLQEGMTPQDVAEILKPPVEPITFKGPELANFSVATYSMEKVVGVSGTVLKSPSNSKDDTMTGSTRSGRYSYPKKESVQQKYVLIYEQGKLVYWGAVEDLAGHNDPALNLIGANLEP